MPRLTTADERMYDAKTQHYLQMGVDRRGLQAAHVALCALYTKILKINITNDTFQVVDMDIKERTETMGFDERISVWLRRVGQSDMVHPDDRETYLAQTSLPYIRQYFADCKSSLCIFYRRRIDGQYKQVMMEMIRANDYSLEHQSLFLYVKCIDK